MRRLHLAPTPQLDDLARAAGELYSRVVVSFWRTVRKKNVWLKPSSMMRWHTSNQLHAHSADAVVQGFYDALKSWRKRRKTDPQAKPPYRRRRYCWVQWKSSAIRVQKGELILSNGRGNASLVVPWPWEAPVRVELGWTGTEYELRAVYSRPAAEPVAEGGVAGADLGEVHLAVVHDGERTTIYNGRELRAKRQYQNKIKAALAAKQSRLKKGSRRWRRLGRSKQKQLRKLENQIRDILHKQTTALVSTLHDRGVQTVVIGDVRNLRKRVDYGPAANQRIHQMVSGRVRQRLGMQAVLQNEAYTSQECPRCGSRHKPRGREYACSACGFRFHRDGVGAVNIRRKYLGRGPVVGAMASPTGVRWQPHRRVRVARDERERIPAL
ncbi:RNA-guided endonuclease TnpB family protein [Meiothermus sp. Pnk-1]|uniref:RNA-guided endonuclease InsQ/TnpB family protein n=1 Tax=Meiothermus sp. Pnk-1 TaxID=873128 RepID=UPI000D7C0592|nr:RNA-guided endonuclease TnpB family protein [Meiothermus sp. Pnk-1]PZA06018.1 transposase [Meiothermus sp. Pnk-1]RYM35272.1 transposase [Meiothermus sp. PNK-Is4]